MITITFKGESRKAIEKSISDYLTNENLSEVATQQEKTKTHTQASESTKPVKPESVFAFDYDRIYDSWPEVFHALGLVSSSGQIRKNLPVNRQLCDSEDDFLCELRKWLAKNTPLKLDNVKVKEVENITKKESEVNIESIDIYSL